MNFYHITYFNSYNPLKEPPKNKHVLTLKKANLKAYNQCYEKKHPCMSTQ